MGGGATVATYDYDAFRILRAQTSVATEYRALRRTRTANTAHAPGWRRVEVNVRDLHELGLNVYGNPVGTPPPTANQLEVVEQLAGVELPADYVEFLQSSNGGYPELNTFCVEVAAQGYREEWGISSFFSIASDDPLDEDTGTVVWNHRHRWENAPRQILPIARTPFGDLLCLDLTQEGNGRVVLWARERPGWARGALPAADVLLPVAASFEEFIDSLTVAPDAG